MKNVFYKNAKEKIKNNAAPLMFAATVVGATALVLLARGCPGTGTGRYEPLCEPVANDGICCVETESYPYLRNADGTIRTRNGSRAAVPEDCMQGGANVCVPNSDYSKEDCFRGDNVCDGSADPAQLRDPAGNTVQLRNPDGTPAREVRYRSGRVIPLPLEDANSYDCQMEQARQQMCGPREGQGALPQISRPLVTTSDPLTPLVQRSQRRVVAMFASPESVNPGNNYLVEPNGYRESCDTNLPVCDGDSPVACQCPNHSSCAPAQPVVQAPPPHCGNGRVERNLGEQCDTRSRSPRGGCDAGHRCTASCGCERLPPPPPTCPNNRVDPGEQCDPPNSRCGTAGTCNTSCQCDEPPPQPPPQQEERCPSHVGNNRTLVVRTSGGLNRKAMELRSALGAGDQDVLVTVRVGVTTAGAVSVRSATASCSGQTCPQSADILGTSQLSLQGVTVPGVERDCYADVPVTIRREGTQ